MKFWSSNSVRTNQPRRPTGQRRPFLSICLALGCLLLAPATARAEDPSFADAVAQFKKGNWSDAYGRFIEMANEGDADAARISLFMLRYGRLLYGSNWDAAPEDSADWQRLANSNQGRSGPIVETLQNRDRALRRTNSGSMGKRTTDTRISNQTK